MAWNSQPQGRRGYFWMHQPTVVFEADLDNTNTQANGKVTATSIYQHLYVTNITVGALTDLVDGMTLSMGTAAQSWDYGFCRVRGTTVAGGGTTTVDAAGATAGAVGNNAGNHTWQGQIVRVSVGTLSQITAYFGASTGTPTGTVTWQLHTVSGGVPTATVLDSDTFTPTASANNTITVTGGPLLSAGTDYALTMHATDNQAENNYWAWNCNGSDVYADGTRVRSLDNGGSWTALGTNDMRCTITTTGATVILVWIGGNSAHSGDLALGTGTRHLTAWNEYRLWAKPPYYDDDGVGWYDGNQSNGVGGPNYAHPPVANGGPPVMGWRSESTGVLEVNLPASRSYRVEHTACLGSWSADLAPASTITSSSESGANIDDNVVDGNTATYWSPSAALPQWIQFELAADQRVYKFSITASTTTAPMAFKFKVRDCERGLANGYDDVLTVTAETGWGSHETRTFYVDVDHANEVWGSRDSAGHTTYRINVTATNGGTLRIEEVKLYAETRTGGATEAYTWDVGDGTITVGTVNSETPTVTFPPGFRYISLTATDSDSTTDITHIPVLVFGSAWGSEMSYASATPTAKTNSADADHAFDGNTVTYWACSVGDSPTWIQTQLSAPATVNRYGVRCPTTNYAIAWTFSGSANGTAWTVLDSRSGQDWSGLEVTKYFLIPLDKIASYTYYRLTISSYSGTSVRIKELDLFAQTSSTMPMTSVEVESRDLAIEGQTLTAVVHQDISDYPDGCLVMYGEDEWFAGVKGAATEAEYTLANRAPLKFWGWIETEEPTHDTGETGLVTSTRLTCYDVGRKLSTLPGWNLVFERMYSPSYSYEMRHPNIDRMTWFVARYMTNAANITDVFWSGTGDWFGVGVLGIYGGDLYTMLNSRADAAGMRLGCNKFGQLRMRLDQNLQISTYRDTTVDKELTESTYRDLRWTHTKDPRYNREFGSGISTYLEDWDTVGFAVTTNFTMTPGQVPIQGVQEVDLGEQVVDSAFGILLLQYREANRFESRLAAEDTGLSFTLCGGNDIGLDPAEIQPFWLDLGASYAAQRGKTFTQQTCYPTRLSIAYNNEGFFNTVSVEAELYVAASYYSLSYTP